MVCTLVRGCLPLFCPPFESAEDSVPLGLGKRFLVSGRAREAETYQFEALQPDARSGAGSLRLRGWQGVADRYLTAWQEGDWNRIYEFEGRLPDVRPILHQALTDKLEFYTINEVRYSDSAAACAVTLRWIASEAEYTVTGELYLERVGMDWRVTGFRSF